MALTLKLIAINNNPFLNPDYINHKRTDSETWNQAVSKTEHREPKRNHLNGFPPKQKEKRIIRSTLLRIYLYRMENLKDKIMN